MTTLFYMVYFKSTKPIMKLNDFMFDLSCSVVASRPHKNKNYIIDKVLKYPQVSIVYNALRQTYYNDPSHKKYDINIIHILMMWAKNNIQKPIEEKVYKFGLESIKEENEEELIVFDIYKTTDC